MLTRRRPAPQKWPPPRAGRWFAAPRPLRRTQKPVPGWWKPFVYGVFLLDLAEKMAGRRSLVLVDHLAVYVLFFGLLLGLALWLCWRAMEIFALRSTPKDRALSDAPPGLTEFPVEIVLHDAHGSYGADRGFVWFEDGLMTFNGAACSFVVSAADLYSRREPNGKNLYHQMPGNAVRFRVPGKTVYATVRPLSGLRGLAFDYHLGRFLASVPSGDRPRQWPPFMSFGMQPSASDPTLNTPEAVGEAAARTGSAFGVVRNRP